MKQKELDAMVERFCREQGIKPLPNSHLTYGAAFPNHRIDNDSGNRYKWSSDSWVFVCGPEDC